MRIGFTGMLILAGSCAARDLPMGWDTTAITREVNADLRRFEHLKSDLSDVKVLAWHKEERQSPNPFPFPPNAPIGAPPQTSKLDIVLLWGRIAPANDGLGWGLVQAYRRPDDENPTWRRSVFFRDWKVPPTDLRPGETADGEWHGFQRYAHAPTSSEICQFANVDFLRAPRFEWRTVKARVQTNTWRSVTGADPQCLPAPPGPPAPERPPEPPWAKDFAHQSFASPLSVVDAQQILIRTDIFEFGTMPPKRQVQALNALLDQPDALLQFDTVARRGNLAGRVYAMCGFLLLGAQQGTALRSALATEQGRILVIEHDVIRGSMTVENIVILIQREQLCGAMRADGAETVEYFQSPAR